MSRKKVVRKLLQLDTPQVLPIFGDIGGVRMEFRNPKNLPIFYLNDGEKAAKQQRPI